jgi:tagatose 1,6-diphosphate aldolase
VGAARNLTPPEKESKRNKTKDVESDRKVSPGKRKKLEKVSDSRGIIAALACDQRQALRSLFAKAMGVGPEAVADERLAEFKEAVSRFLTPHASAILLDPEYGLPAAQQRAKSAGLLLAYEETGHDATMPGRMPRLLERWSVRRLVEAGADCVKLLLYYSTASSPEIRDRKHAFVERVGAECAAADVPFFLELVTYSEGGEEKGPEFAAQKPSVVANVMREFSRQRYQVDVLKVGVPVNVSHVEGSPCLAGPVLYHRDEAVEHYRRAAEATHLPFIYLSEGVSNEAFQFALELAEEAGVKFSGVLCGRATWKEGVAALVEMGQRALEDWLGTEGVQNIQNVNQRLRGATPWFARLAEPSPTEGRECFSA